MRAAWGGVPGQLILPNHGPSPAAGASPFGVPPGWPWTKTAMTREEAEALHAYLIDVQWKTYNEGPRGLKSAER